VFSCTGRKEGRGLSYRHHISCQRRDRVQLHGAKGVEGPFVIIFNVLKVRITLDSRKTVGTAPMLTFFKKANSTSKTIEGLVAQYEKKQGK
jgi:hypothetical protein